MSSIKITPRRAALTVATDGSCLKNPGGPTGWAWVAEDGRWATGCQPSGTNQVAELWGVLGVLRDLPTTPLNIQIDSQYAMKVATVWGPAWAKNGWKKRDGKPVENGALVKGIWNAMRSRVAPVDFIHVPGHDPQNRWPLNTYADSYAQKASRWARDNGRMEVKRGTDAEVVATLARCGLAPSTTQRTTAKPLAVPSAELCNSCGTLMDFNGECNCSR